jgi:asparagine synthetase B (glutamine-hydrolysing)
MCGIAGIYDCTSTGRADPAAVDRMALALVHRGPVGDAFRLACLVVLALGRPGDISREIADRPIHGDRSTALTARDVL